eukprot:10405220-Alexandrium_andersonii.AAC.1
MECSPKLCGALFGDGPKVKHNAALNSSLAKVEKGPTFHMEVAMAPGMPVGRNVLFPGSETADLGD